MDCSPEMFPAGAAEVKRKRTTMRDGSQKLHEPDSRQKFLNRLAVIEQILRPAVEVEQRRRPVDAQHRVDRREEALKTDHVHLRWSRGRRGGGRRPAIT